MNIYMIQSSQIYKITSWAPKFFLVIMYYIHPKILKDRKTAQIFPEHSHLYCITWNQTTEYCFNASQLPLGSFIKDQQIVIFPQKRKRGNIKFFLNQLVHMNNFDSWHINMIKIDTKFKFFLKSKCYLHRLRKHHLIHSLKKK